MDPLTIGLVMGGISLISSLVGGGLSVWSNSQRSKEEQERIEEQKRLLEEQLKRDLAIYDEKFRQAKTEALKNAATSDKNSDLSESLLARAYNNKMEEIGLQQEVSNFQKHNSIISYNEQKAAAESALGASGVRSGSSAANAITQKSELYERQLELSEKSQEAQSKWTLESAYAQLLGNMNALQGARTDAHDLRTSYDPNGSQTRLYNMQRNNMIERVRAQQKQLNRAKKNAEYTPLEGFTDFFTGGSAGFQFGQQVGEFAYKWGMNWNDMFKTGGKKQNVLQPTTMGRLNTPNAPTYG